MKVTGVLAANRVGKGIEEGDHVVPNPLLEPRDVVGIDTRLEKPLQHRPRDLAQVGPTLTDGELDSQPQLVPLLWREDLAHLRVSVSRDQSAAGLLWGGGPSVTRLIITAVARRNSISVTSPTPGAFDLTGSCW